MAHGDITHIDIPVGDRDRAKGFYYGNPIGLYEGSTGAGS